MARLAKGASVVALAVAPALVFGCARAPGRDERAARIYWEGILPSGQPLLATRAGGGEVAGAAAACVHCHRPSGMGAVEGDRLIPPIIGKYLYRPRAQTATELDGRHTRGPDLAHAFGRNRPRPPYSDKTLERAIRDGIDPAGRHLDPLMPRYRLDDGDAERLIAYLQRLSERWSPGVTDDTLHLATVVAPGVDAKRRAAMLDVLFAFVAVRNAGTALAQRREQAYASSAHARYRAWRLHVWELTGPPRSWPAQLVAYEQRQPVFALLSGISDGEWAPVAEYCETRQVPCWFPIVDLPPAPTRYSLYFSKGLQLEAELLAHVLGQRRVIMIRADDALAAGAAAALRAALGEKAAIDERVLPTRDAARLHDATADATAADAIVFWLGAADVAQLTAVPVPPAALYFSATLGRSERLPLPPAWKRRAQLAYPFELPERRRNSLARFHAWRATRGLLLVDERVQADAYLASLLLSEKIDELLEDLYGDYLIERAEAILGLRVPTAMYPRLSLGPGQRFASKGGYLVRFASPDGSALVAASDWMTP
jgi:mono/diheme cytochrome c family protein